MAHKEQLDYVQRIREAFPDAFSGKRVLEIGSQDINGTIRGLFQDCDYTGLDVAEGPGVDVVCQGQDYAAPDGSYDTVISCEVMEHNPYWKETFENMLRLCRPGGIVIMTCAAPGRKEHGTTRTNPAASPLTIGLGWDYYRNLAGADFRSAVALGAYASPYAFFRNLKPSDLYFVGFRKGGRLPAGARQRILSLRAHYFSEFFRTGIFAIKGLLLIRLVGEERYFAGPVTVKDLWR